MIPSVHDTGVFACGVLTTLAAIGLYHLGSRWFFTGRFTR